MEGQELDKLPLGAQTALINTRLAFERTLTAWVRTAISLISFGFTIYKAFQYVDTHGPPRAGSVLGPREFGLVMIAMGLIGLTLATIQHLRHVKMLHRMYGKLPTISVGVVIAIMFAALGVAALVSALLRK